MDERKPRKKFANSRQKFHYIQAAKHYHSWRQSANNRDQDMKNQDHIDAYHMHVKHGNLTGWHRDQIQHDAKHFGESNTRHFKPYLGKKTLVVKGMSRKKKLETYLAFQRQMTAGMKSGKRMRDAEEAGKAGQAKRHKRRAQWHALRAKRHAGKLGLKLKSGVKK